MATAAIAGSIALAFQESSRFGMSFLIATAVLVPAVIVAGFKLFPKSPFGRRMVVSGLSFGSSPAMDARDVALAGKEGVIEAACRPAGMARIEGRRVDVVTRGEWIDAGEKVHVVEVQGNRVVVSRVEPR
jgi:membrane-bound serine protease (ClpP class)